MTAFTQLASGLGGAMGSDYRLISNQLFFVEFNNGKVSVLDLVRKLDTVVFSGTATMPANSSLSLFNGTSAQGGQIRWDHTGSGGTLVMRPTGTCRLSYIGVADYNAITQAELQNLTYTYDPPILTLRGEGPNNQLTNGTVFGVFNYDPSPVDNFDYAKVKVLQNAGGSIKVQWVTYRVKPRYSVIGIGYTQPEDIKVTGGGRYAYVTERAGNFLRVDLTNANRVAAQLVTSGLTAPNQIALDEEHGQAYIPEFTSAATGKIWRVDLSGGVKTAIYKGLQGCTGLLISKDLRYAYVAEQVSGANRVARINLATAQRDILATGLTAPFFMEWADTTESRIILAERNPANRITMLDLTATPVNVTALVSGVANNPSSIVLTKPETMIVCSDSEINQYDLVGSAFSLAAPLFMGIGLVPIDHISKTAGVLDNTNTGNNDTDGYADTTDISPYPIHVKDSPFGGAMWIMFNHNAALLAGATYYKLFVSQVTPVVAPPMEPRQSFSDYLWDSASGSFVPQTTNPDAGGFYPVRLPSQIWLNPWWGYMLDTSIFSNGLCFIDIKLYNAAKVEITVGSIHSRRVKIDNQWPLANIEKIFHDGAEVKVCDVVKSGSDQFTFRITAMDPQRHLLSWNLSVMWGDNKSASVGSDDYSKHIPKPPITDTCQWAGVISGDVPTPAWHAAVPGGPVDPTSKHCAHTFYLGVWDRVINGYGYIHYADYHKSITIDVP
jgi:hypothetical protein